MCIRDSLYPDVYKNDHFVEVTEDVLETIQSAERAEAAYDRRMYRYKAYYSLEMCIRDRSSVLDHLKRPVPPRSTDKIPKQHEEVR